MLAIPKDGHGIVKFIGIDPGTNTPGVGIIHYDTVEKRIVKVSAQCLKLERMIRRSPHLSHQAERFLKLMALEKFLTTMFRKERPLGVGCESPFINQKRPGAVIPLAECMLVVERAVYCYDPHTKLEKIDPSTIKKTVGVKGTSSDKHDMTEAMLKIPEIADVFSGDLKSMDNNAVDGVAVAYCCLQRELSYDS